MSNRMVKILFILMFVKSVSLFAGPPPFCIKEIDGSPSKCFYTNLKVSNGALTDNGDGTMTLITGVGGGGDVSGPASATDNAVARFDGVGGKTIQDSLMTVSDTGSVNIPSGQTYQINSSQISSSNLSDGSSLLKNVVEDTTPQLGGDLDLNTHVITGLQIGTNVQAYDADLTTYAGITPSANVQSLLGAANYAAMRALLDLEAGTDFYSISAADAAFQPLDSDLTDLADGSLTGTKVGFADTDSNFVATNIQAAVEELDDVNGSGPNAADGKVDWSQLVNVPAGFADGTDDGSGGGGDSVTANSTAIDTTANFADGNGFTFELTDGGAGGPDTIKVAAGTVNGIVKANGSGDISAATAGTDYTSPSSTESFTNKTFDANGTGNSISNIENADISASAAIAFSKLASLTSANILVGNGSNVATAVSMSGDVTISNAGVTAIGNDKITEAMLKAVDAASDEECLTYETTTGDFEWQTCGSGSDTNSVKEYWWPASATLPLEAADSIPPISKDAGTNVDQLAVLFDSATDECRSVTFKVPSDVASGSTITFRALWYSTATSGDVMWDFRHTSGDTEGESWDDSLTTEAAAADTVQGTTKLITVTTWTETLTNLGWAANDLVTGVFCRDANNGSDTMSADAYAIGFGVEIPRA